MNDSDSTSHIVTSLGSITELFERARDQDTQAARELWQAYSSRLAALATATLRRAGIAEIDAEGDSVANSAFNAFLSALSDGRYHEVKDRDALWRLLATITRNTALSRVRASNVYRRHLASARDEQVNANRHLAEAENDSSIMMADTISRLHAKIDSLSNGAEQADRYRRVLDLSLLGHTQEDIAKMIGRSSATVRRNLRTLGDLLQKLEN